MTTLCVHLFFFQTCEMRRQNEKYYIIKYVIKYVFLFNESHIFCGPNLLNLYSNNLKALKILIRMISLLMMVK